jgi:hypothetical protein
MTRLVHLGRPFGPLFGPPIAPPFGPPLGLANGAHKLPIGLPIGGLHHGPHRAPMPPMEGHVTAFLRAATALATAALARFCTPAVHTAPERLDTARSGMVTREKVNGLVARHGARLHNVVT